MMLPDKLPAFIGEQNKTWRVGGFTFGSWAADRWGDAVMPHGHHRGHFMLVLGGRYSSSLCNNSPDGLPLMIFNPRGTWHRDRFEEPGRFFSIELDLDACCEANDFLPVKPTRIIAGQALALTHRIRREVAGNREAPKVEALTSELIAEFTRPRRERRPPRWLKTITEALRDAAVTPSVAALSRLAGVHPAHLTRTFRVFHGCTPAEYAVRLRLSQAALLVGNTRRPLAEIALDAGFADQSHFTTRFRAVYGLPPGEYRRRLT
jgi:AraC family transcriptional regulator